MLKALIYFSFILRITHALTTVEVNVDSGIGYHLVGLPDNAIK